MTGVERSSRNVDQIVQFQRSVDWDYGRVDDSNYPEHIRLLRAERHRQRQEFEELNDKINDPNFDWSNVDLGDMLQEARENDDPDTERAIHALQAFQNLSK